MVLKGDKRLEGLLVCPSCKLPELKRHQGVIICEACDEAFEEFEGIPLLIKSSSQVLEWYEPNRDLAFSTDQGFRELLKGVYRWLKPESRVWTVKSQQAIEQLLRENNPDLDENNVVLIGTGFESAYRRILKPYRGIIRVGLASRGEVDLFCDICDIPLNSDSIDLVFSSSVLEHVYNPERAVEEMFRVLKPGGFIYAEIPFMRAYHMKPVDYQRYTISGIEELFKRHGFQLINKGICSGPFTASVLFFIDFFRSLLGFNGNIRAVSTLILSLLLHPVKYFDRVFEDSQWAETNACNFYYVGKKSEAI